jgi:protein-S-isoprenylcysteine O-methyltransferase Ste14
MLAPILFSQSAWPLESWPRQAVDFAGSVFIIICIAGRCWASLYVGGRKNRELAIAGPYAYTRNPLYFFSALGLAGVGLTFGSLAIAGFYFAFAYLVFAYVAARETSALNEIFGEAYSTYRQEVPAFSPRLRRHASYVAHPSPVTFDPAVLKRTAIDSSCFLLAIPGSGLVEWLQSSRFITPMLHLY